MELLMSYLIKTYIISSCLILLDILLDLKLMMLVYQDKLKAKVDSFAVERGEKIFARF